MVAVLQIQNDQRLKEILGLNNHRRLLNAVGCSTVYSLGTPCHYSNTYVNNVQFHQPIRNSRIGLGNGLGLFYVIMSQIIA